MSHINIPSTGGGGGGNTVSAGVGISVIQSGSDFQVTNTGIIKYVSPQINFKNTGLTTLFTTTSGFSFYTIACAVIIDSSISANQDATFNLGFTPAIYDDFGTFQDAWDGSVNYRYNDVIKGSDFQTSIPDNTNVVCNITSGDTGTAQIARIVFIGFYAT